MTKKVIMIEINEQSDGSISIENSLNGFDSPLEAIGYLETFSNRIKKELLYSFDSIDEDDEIMDDLQN